MNWNWLFPKMIFRLQLVVLLILLMHRPVWVVAEPEVAVELEVVRIVPLVVPNSKDWKLRMHYHIWIKSNINLVISPKFTMTFWISWKNSNLRALTHQELLLGSLNYFGDILNLLWVSILFCHPDTKLKSNATKRYVFFYNYLSICT